MKNPLRKRLLRELRGEWKKYLVLFLLLSLSIGFVSGMFVANDSMEKSAEEAYEKYNIEDGHFELKDRATDSLLSEFEKTGIDIYNQFYKDLEEDFNLDGEKDATVRVFVMRDEVNLACLMSGNYPKNTDEIVIDRMHGDNNGIRVGDKIKIGGREMTVCGLVAFSDYSTLFEDNNDTMFDALTFNIASVTEECFENLDMSTVYQYSFKYNDPPATVEEQKEKSDALIEKIAVLSATGGMLDNKDEAKELNNNVEEWKKILIDAKAESEELEKRKAELEEKAATAAASGDIDLLTVVNEESTALQSDADAFLEKQNEIERAADKLKALEKYEDDINEVTDYVPEYANRAIHFAPNDFGSDKRMGEILLVILVIILGFIFAITASSTIVKESSAIGTLRASGYTKGELLRHYMTLPVLVTVAAAIFGNILGYTVFKDVVVSMYYNSYSLPAYVTRLNSEAFIKTTLYPVLIMILLNFIIIRRKLNISPLRFLRGDLGARENKKAVKLPDFGFMHRFRLRILLKNLSGYLTLFFGLLFVMVLLAFSVGMPATLSNYQSKAKDLILTDYQYILKDYEDVDGNIIITSTPSAEKYCVTSLETTSGVKVGEEVTVYGYIEGSKYVKIDGELKENEVYLSSGYADKFGLKTGDEIVLKEKYTSKKYTFKVAGIYDLPSTIAVMMPYDSFNTVFDREDGSFNGYFSENEINDIDEKYVATVITVDDTVKMAKQLDHSMGSYMDYFAVICTIAAALVMFLLTKLIIEKNTTSISMVKVLGYYNGEINSLYVGLTTVFVIISSLITAFLSILILEQIWKLFMYGFSGWFTFYMGAGDILKIIIMVIAAYIIVAFFDLRRVKKIPMTDALKNVE